MKCFQTWICGCYLLKNVKTCLPNNKFVYTLFNSQLVLFLIIPFHVICLHTAYVTNSFIWSIRGTQSDATITCQSGPGSDGNDVILNIIQSPKAGSLPSGGFMSYRRHSFLGVGINSLERCSQYIQMPHPNGLLIAEKTDRKMIFERKVRRCKKHRSYFELSSPDLIFPTFRVNW